MKQRAKKLTQISEAGTDDFDNIISPCRLTTGFDERIDKTGKTNKVGEIIINPPNLMENLSPEELALAELKEAFDVFNTSIEEIKIRYKTNIESILISQKSTLLCDVKNSITRAISNIFSVAPLQLRRLLRNDQQEQKYGVSVIQSDLILPDPIKDQGKYEKWAERENKDETPLDFLYRVWGKYIETGLLTQSALGGSRSLKKPKTALDKTLFDRLKNQCKVSNLTLRHYLPSKSNEVSKKMSKNIQENLAT